MMGICGQLFTLVGKGTKDVTTPADARLPLHGCIDAILTKAAHCVMPEVGSQGLVTFVLIVSNTFAEHVNQWVTQPLCTLIVTSGLKKEYIGDCQVFFAAAEI
jgi:hypothetical protein